MKRREFIGLFGGTPLARGSQFGDQVCLLKLADGPEDSFAGPPSDRGGRGRRANSTP
jgi:hypothetical protein